MCIIYHKPKGVVIPYEKFERSVLNNPHGYGISVVDEDNMLTTIREVQDKPDPEALYKLITEDFDNDHMMIHLRYNTVGETTLRNCHPFPILERGPDGVDVRMSHNGTIPGFRPLTGSPHSDTRMFVSEVVRPLFKRLVFSYDEPSDVLDDPMVTKILTGLIPSGSVLCFLSGDGKVLKVNPTGNGGGEQEGGYWASNTYSFQDNYRTRGTQVGKTVYGQSWGEDYEKWWTETSKHYRQGSAVVEVRKEVDKPVTSVDNFNPSNFAKDTQVQKFTTKYNLSSIDECFDFGDELLELLDEEDDLMLLTKELLAELYTAKATIKKLRMEKGDSDAEAA